MLGPKPLSTACSQGTGTLRPEPLSTGCCSFHNLFAALSSNVFLVASESDVRHCLPPNAPQGRGMLGPEPLSLVAACWAESHFLQLVPKALPKALASNASQGPGNGPRAKLCFQNVFLVASESDVRHCFPANTPQGRGMLGPEPLSLVAASTAFLQLCLQMFF